jgi:hypothetical protein
MVGLYPNLEFALYIIALVLNVFRAAYGLAQFVYSQQQLPNTSS